MKGGGGHCGQVGVGAERGGGGGEAGPGEGKSV